MYKDAGNTTTSRLPNHAATPTHPQKLVLPAVTYHLAPNDGSAIQEREDVLDERLLLPLPDHHVGNLDHRVLIRL